MIESIFFIFILLLLIPILRFTITAFLSLTPFHSKFKLDIRIALFQSKKLILYLSKPSGLFYKTFFFF